MQSITFILAILLLAFTSPAQTNRALIQFGEKYTLHSRILNEDRAYWVYLPPSYQINANHTSQNYPVLYLLDGEWNFDWACEMVRFLSDSLEAPEIIVVGIPNTDRERDLTPTHVTNIVSSGGGLRFEKFLRDELATEIDAKWRTAPYRILVGHSLGGALAVDSFLCRNNGFQAYVAIDPSLWWDNRILVQRAKEFSPNTDSHVALFIAEANWPHNLYDATNSNKYASDLFLSALKTNPISGIRVGSHFFDLEDHASVRLMGLYNGLRFIFENYKPTNFYALNTPALLDEHFKKISECLSLQIRPPEAYVNKIADSMLSAANAGKAVELFKLNLTNYPAAASVYRHLGDAYRIKGDKELAIQNYKKALALSPNMDSAKEALNKLK